MTKKEMFAMIATVNADNVEIVEFCNHEIELLSNRKSGTKTPTKAQKENEVIMANILEALADIGEPTTVTGLIQHGVKGFPTADGKVLTSQKTSPLLRKLVDAGKVVKTIEGKRALFALA